jgi:hypothetical protein
MRTAARKQEEIARNVALFAAIAVARKRAEAQADDDDDDEGEVPLRKRRRLPDATDSAALHLHDGVVEGKQARVSRCLAHCVIHSKP